MRLFAESENQKAKPDVAATHSDIYLSDHTIEIEPLELQLAIVALGVVGQSIQDAIDIAFGIFHFQKAGIVSWNVGDVLPGYLGTDGGGSILRGRRHDFMRTNLSAPAGLYGYRCAATASSPPGACRQIFRLQLLKHPRSVSQRN